MDKGLVCIVDDDLAARKSLGFMLDMAGFKTMLFESGPKFLESIDLNICKCLIADVRMPQMSGLELLERAKEKRPDLAVIVITGHGDIPLAVDAMRRGAADFIEKPFDNERLMTAINFALRGPAPRGVDGEQRADVLRRLEALSPREHEVMLSLVRGNPNKIVAHELGISVRTVEIHRANVMSKTGSRSLAELVRLALVAGFLTA
ncbi:transcriptional regulatory protein FixJ [Terrihabitans soli]|uniref:Transcriptional regulatory protein FixJ n=1 Tax=Terrihabitans soli TaxID=708113 RepID=A0A6S6QT64_9HYPH|nr:response regulator [Terrihabitans soli]BCJ92289.1 transcriptional regulatory protein FixJ [Terrihabitans soli]